MYRSVGRSALWIACLWQIGNGVLLTPYAIANWLWLTASRRRLLVRRSPGQARFLILIPVLHEAHRIGASLLSIESMVNTYGGGATVVVITTEKEGIDLNDRRHTAFALQETIRRRQFSLPVLHFHYNSPDGTKADQLNFAIDSLRGSRDAFDYVLVTDADTRMDSRLLCVMNSMLAEREARGLPFPVAMQPVVLTSAPTGHFRGFGNLVATADAVIQSRWRLGFELMRMRLASAAAAHRGLLWRIIEPIVYCVGACFAVKAVYIFEHRFPTPMEDTALGYRLSFAGLEIAPVPSVATTAGEVGVGRIVRQQAHWFLSTGTLSKEWVDYVRGPTRHSMRVRATWLFVKDQARRLGWLPGPFITIGLLGLFAITNREKARRGLTIWVALSILGYMTCFPVVSLINSAIKGRIMSPPGSSAVLGTLTCHLGWVWRSLLPAVFLVSRRMAGAKVLSLFREYGSFAGRRRMD